jgi:hypothetical protein
MKTMTCKQMGGPCDAPLRGNSADEVIKADDQHLRDMVAGGDEAHKAALTMMEGRWIDPAGGMEWYTEMQADFTALPEDAS